MALWLCKQEPDCYGLADLERDGSTTWDGVANPVARKNLRQMKPGDRVLFYHTGKEKSVVGEMEVAADPTTPEGDEKAVVVEMKFIRRLEHPVTLAEIKADKSLETWDLVRLSRLSVMGVSEQQWKRVMQLSKDKAVAKKK
ncbi:EVE domain-containing protein [Zavarzinella formosa]|uniref:EVE domain-containing protein n=1 Tax=Zavarzinella formosa TaxID=360055 RepID=UPI0002D74179|nr:EVE domain-containing protein [Zavarzinella formosa]